MKKYLILASLIALFCGFSLNAAYKSKPKFSKLKASQAKELPSVPWSQGGAYALEHQAGISKGYKYLVITGSMSMQWFEKESYFSVSYKEIFIKGPIGDNKKEKIEPIGQISPKGRFMPWSPSINMRRDFKAKKTPVISLPKIVFVVPENLKKVSFSLHGKVFNLKIGKANLNEPLENLAVFKTSATTKEHQLLISGQGHGNVSIKNQIKAKAGKFIQVDIDVLPKQNFTLYARNFTLITNDGYALAPVGGIHYGNPEAFSPDYDKTFTKRKGKFESQKISLIFNIGNATKSAKLNFLSHELKELNFAI